MKINVLFLILILTLNICLAEDFNNQVQTQAQVSITQPQNVSFENCTKMFNVNKEKLFYLTLSGISANKFRIDEIQTENGYVIFSVGKNKYLCSIAGIDAENSILKITPCNEIYFFPPGIVINMFKYIDLNLNTVVR